MLGSPLTDKIGNEVCDSQNVTGYQIGIIYHAENATDDDDFHIVDQNNNNHHYYQQAWFVHR